MPAIGARPWTPREIATTAWYDAADVSTITEDGGLVSQINDKGTVGTRHLLQATGANKPSTGTRTLNGLNVLDHDGARLMRTASFAWPTSGNAAVFAVAVVDVVDNSTDAIFGTSDDDGVGLKEFDLRADNASVFNGKVFATNLGGDMALTGGPFPGPAVYNANFDFTGGILNAYVNGTKRTADSTYSSKFQANGTFNAFAKANNAAQRPDGAWGEIIITEDVTFVTRQKIEGYLAWKWGLVANLPNNHPYRFRPPTATSQDNRPDWTPEALVLDDWKDVSDASTLWEDDAGTIPATTSVGRVDDKTGNNHQWTQSTTSQKPQLGRTLNGLDALDFNGAGTDANGSRMEIANAFELMGKEVWCVVQTDGADTANNNKILGSASPSNGQQVSVKPLTQGGTMRSWAGVSPWSADTAGPAVPAGVPSLLGYRMDPAAKKFVLNGVQQTTTDTDLANGNLTPNTVGYGTFTPTFDGLIAELIITNGLLSEDDRRRMEGYLAHKWGLTGNLPSDHPYKTKKPKLDRLWTPSEIATEGWYDAADTSTVTDAGGGAVSAWNDKSGNANHLAQATPAQQPTVSGNKVSFGLDDNMDFTTPLGTTYYMFAVGAPRVNTALRTLLYTSPNNHPFVVNNGSDQCGIYTGSFSGALAKNWAEGERALMGFGASGQAFQKNGDDLAFVFFPSVDKQATALGGNAGTDSEGFGDVNEVVIVNTPIDTADVWKIEGYLAWKWGINHQLPATHPYRARPPYA